MSRILILILVIRTVDVDVIRTVEHMQLVFYWQLPAPQPSLLYHCVNSKCYKPQKQTKLCKWMAQQCNKRIKI
jgi:hypothetical protein